MQGIRRVCVMTLALVATMWLPAGSAAADSITTVDSCPAAGAVAVPDRQESVAASAPEGYRITAYCVTVRGQGSEVHELAAPSAVAELGHSSGKAIEEYVLAYEEIPGPAPEPEESASPAPDSGPTTGDPAEEAEETDDMEATDSTDHKVRSESSYQDSLMDIDALLGNRAYAEARASRSPMEAVTTSAERAPSGPGTFVAAALVVIGLAGTVAVVQLLRRRKRQAERADDPAPPRESAPPHGPGPEAGPRPRHAAPTFVVDDDAGDFPSIR